MVKIQTELQYYRIHSIIVQEEILPLRGNKSPYFNIELCTQSLFTDNMKLTLI